MLKLWHSLDKNIYLFLEWVGTSINMRKRERERQVDEGRWHRLYSMHHLALRLVNRGPTAALTGAERGLCLDLVATPADWPWLTVGTWVYIISLRLSIPVVNPHEPLPAFNPQELSSCLHGWNILYQKSLMGGSVKGQYTTLGILEIMIICTQLNGIKYSYLIQIICTRMGICKIIFVCTQLYGIKYFSTDLFDP